MSILYLFRFSKLFTKHIYLNAPLFFLNNYNKKKNYKLAYNTTYFLNKSRTFALLSKFRKLFKSSVLIKKKLILNLILFRKRSLLKRKYNFKKLLFKKNYQRIKKTTFLRKKFHFFRDFKKKKFFLKKTSLISLSSKKIFFDRKKEKKITNNNFKKVFKKKQRIFINVFRKFIKNLKINRELIKELFFKKFTRQHKITNFFKKFNQSRNINVLTILQSFLYIVLLNCQFFKFKVDVFFYLKKFGVFVNGVLCFNPYKVLAPNDVIQLPILNQYYFFFKHQQYMTNLFFLKYKKKYNKLYASPHVK